jgi:hypothetical protein
MDGLGLVCEACPVEGGIQPITRAVTSKNPPGAIATMCGRRQAANKDPRSGVAEARQRLSPVFLISKGGALLAGNLLAPTNQPRALATDDDSLIQRR